MNNRNYLYQLLHPVPATASREMAGNSTSTRVSPAAMALLVAWEGEGEGWMHIDVRVDMGRYGDVRVDMGGRMNTSSIYLSLLTCCAC